MIILTKINHPYLRRNEFLPSNIYFLRGSSILNKFHETLGQFLDYRDAMQESKVDR